MGIFNKTKEKKVSIFKRITNACKRRQKPESFTKRWVEIILINAIIWVYLSYALAFLGRGDIAEQLSITVVKIIIFTFIPYLCKALFENIFKYGNLKIPINPYIKEDDDSVSMSETESAVNDTDTNSADVAG